MKLRAAIEAYCIARAKGMSQIDAWRDSHPASTATRATMDQMACRAEKRPAVLARIHDLTSKSRELAAVKHKRAVKKVDQAVVDLAAVEVNTVQQIAVSDQLIMQELWDNAQIAKAAKPVRDREGAETGEYTANFSASNQALIALGKHIGMFQDKPHKPDELDGLTHQELKELKAMIEERMADDPAPAPLPRGTRSATH